MADYWGPCGPGDTFFRNRLESEDIANQANRIPAEQRWLNTPP